MDSIIDQRVFFKRKALGRLQSYWCKRWDELMLREMLSRSYTPRYHVEAEYLDGYYIKLKNIDFLWFRGLFSVGRHLKSGRYYQDPIHLSLNGLGPRELVFPLMLVDHLAQLSLLGDWTRYQLSAENWINETREVVKLARKGGFRVEIRVEEVGMGFPPPIIAWWGRREVKAETVYLKGEVVSGMLAGYKLEVPISEVFWNNFTKI